MSASARQVSVESTLARQVSRVGRPETEAPGAAVAIVGMACRVPGADSPEELWKRISNGEVLVERLDEKALSEAGVPRHIYSNASYVPAFASMSGISLFDEGFFGMSSHEAEILDPQHRIFLEGAWHALEAAGHRSDDGAVLAGVFAGMGAANYHSGTKQLAADDDPAASFERLISSDKDFLTTRVAYKLNLKGPAITVQTGCSSSLVAVHLACQSLLLGECDIAFAGGVSISSFQRKGYTFQEGMVLSRDGHCRPFDRSATGTVPSSGMGVVALKRLEDAIHDGNHIHAVILGSAVNNDGASKAGYTAPSVEGQVRVVREALAAAQVDPSSIGMVEAHGTGTIAGDPIEVEALSRAYACAERHSFIALASLKANLGHLDAAAGVVGLIKAALCIEHATIVPQPHFTAPNDAIDLEASPFFIAPAGRPWTSGSGPRRAGVSSLGIGGTNAHVILGNAPPSEARSRPRAAPFLLLASAKDERSLDDLASSFASELEQDLGARIADAAYSSQLFRNHLPFRRAAIATTGTDGANGLRAPDGIRSFEGVAFADRPVVFMFPGHGGEKIGVARSLYEQEPRFRSHLDRCAELASTSLGFNFLEYIYPDQARLDMAKSMFSRNSFTQAVMFCVEYSLAQVYLEYGLSPSALIGHSSGEYVAACIAGVMSVEDGLRLSIERGRLIEDSARGAMIAITADRDLRDLDLPEGAELSVVNSPRHWVLSCSVEEADGLQVSLHARGLEVRRLNTPYAGHSSKMDDVAKGLELLLREVVLNEPGIPIVSSATGGWAEGLSDARCWMRHTREVVRFSAGVEALMRWAPDALLVEVGPGAALSSFAAVHESTRRAQVITTLAASGTPDPVKAAIAKCWVSGAAVDWSRFNAGCPQRFVKLPSYPFRRNHHWIGQPDAQANGSSSGAGKASQSWCYVPGWEEVAPPGERTQPDVCVIISPWGGIEDAVRACDFGARTRTMIVPGLHGDRGPVEGYVLEAGAIRKSLSLADFLSGSPSSVLVVYVCTLLETGEEPSEELTRDFRDLTALTAAVGRDAPAADVALIVLSSGIWRVTESDVVRPSQSLVIGPAAVAPREYPQIRTSVVDLDEHGPAGIEKALSANLADLNQSAPAGCFAVRGGRWYRRIFRNIELPQPDRRPALLRTKGTYVITGGTGGLGGVLATYLATSCGANLILAQRGRVPPREQWKLWLELFGPTERISQQIALIQSLEQAGSRVELVEGDIAEFETGEKIRVAARALGRVRGIFHAAGVASGGVIDKKSMALAEETLRPKVQGTQVLLSAFPPADLDFAMLFSSISCVIGHAGQVDHAAANAYLDAQAWSFEGSEARVMSINWDTWRDVGAAARATSGEEVTSLRRSVKAVQAGGAIDLGWCTGDELQWSFMTDLRRPDREDWKQDLRGLADRLLHSVVNCVPALEGRAFECTVEPIDLCAVNPQAAHVELGFSGGVGQFQIFLSEGLPVQSSILLASGSLPTAEPGYDSSREKVGTPASARPAGLVPPAAQLDARTGLGILRAALDSPHAQIAVSTSDLHRRLSSGDMSPSEARPERWWPPSSSGAKALEGCEDSLSGLVESAFDQLLGCGPVAATKGFFDLGGNSLTALRLASLLSRNTGITVRPGTIAERPTIASLTAYLRKELAGTGHSGTGQSESIELLTLRPPRDKGAPPLFLIHPAGGTAMCYRALAEALDVTCAVYGIQVAANGADPEREMAAIAGSYLERIDSVPRGSKSFSVGGASFGGAAAFEIAARAIRRGSAVDRVLMIDTPPAGWRSRRRSEIEMLAYILGLQVEFPLAASELCRLGRRESLSLLSQLASDASSGFSSCPTPDELEYVWDMCVAHGAALRDFKPARSPVNLVYYKAAERDEFTPSNSDRFWRRLASGDVKVHQAEGNHISMLSPGHVKGLAQSISSYLG